MTQIARTDFTPNADSQARGGYQTQAARDIRRDASSFVSEQVIGPGSSARVVSDESVAPVALPALIPARGGRVMSSKHVISVLSFSFVSALPLLAFAQGDPAAPAPAPLPAPTPPPAAAAPPPPAPVPADPPVTPAPAVGAPEAAPPAEAKWYDRVTLGAFVDAYGSLNPYNPRKGAITGVNNFRGFDVYNGFALHWVGLDASVDPDPIGGGVSLRYGPSAALYTGSPDNELGLTNVKQMYVAWKPGGAKSKLKLILGKFDTIYGAEVADTQLNVTYTRSMLFYFAQPFFHTGVRADYDLNDMFSFRVMAVNGWNNAVDNNAMKTFGTQVAVKPNDKLLFSVGWLFGPEQADSVPVSCGADTVYDRGTASCVASPGAGESTTVLSRGASNRRLRHIVDFVVDWNPTSKIRALFNFDWATENFVPVGSEIAERKIWWGADLTLRGQVHKKAFVGVRGSYFRDRDGFLVGTPDTNVMSGTLTLGYMPSANLIFKLEPRLDKSNQESFLRSTETPAKVQFTTTLGVVVTTN